MVPARDDRKTSAQLTSMGLGQAPPGGSPRQVLTHNLPEGAYSCPCPQWQGGLGTGEGPCTWLHFSWRGEPGAPGYSPSACKLLRSGREPDTAPGPTLAGIPAGSWGAARCSRQSGEPLGDSPTPPATGQGPFLP